MPQQLVIEVRLLDGRYHGRIRDERGNDHPEWPPSPARLFQALTAAAARGSRMDDEDVAALEWLESCGAPTISAPTALEGGKLVLYVPNNDVDAAGGDIEDVSSIRVPKFVRPMLVSSDEPLRYVFPVNASAPHAALLAGRITHIAQRLYQLGRGVDMASADARLVEDDPGGGDFRSPSSLHWRPGPGVGRFSWQAPGKGSLASLRRRHVAFTQRLSTRLEGGVTQFTQPPRALFRTVEYECPPNRALYELSGGDGLVQLSKVVRLVEAVRDGLAARLAPGHGAQVERQIVGRGATAEDLATRIRILPIPSIGHRHADHAVRRILVEAPQACPVPWTAIRWGLEQLSLLTLDRQDAETGEVVSELFLSSTPDLSMLRHYGIDAGNPARVWRTITPVALPKSRSLHLKGSERMDEEAVVHRAVLRALTQAGHDALVSSVKVQREPFHAHGVRAEAFAPESRFSASNLWHVQVEFAAPRSGPLHIGDGRFLGLGLMAPNREYNRRKEAHTAASHRVRIREDVLDPDVIVSLKIEDGLTAGASTLGLCRALRRAVLARVQAELGSGSQLPTWFHGHLPDGRPSDDPEHGHLAVILDRPRDRFLIVPPHVLGRRPIGSAGTELECMALLIRSMRGMTELLAGNAGRLSVRTGVCSTSRDPLALATRFRKTLTPYSLMRDRNLKDPERAIRLDVEHALRQLDLTPRSVTVGLARSVREMDSAGKRRGRLAADLVVEFETPPSGLIAVGQSRHFGGGVLAPCKSEVVRE
jgi:CRISPR-associated protein Csb2